MDRELFATNFSDCPSKLLCTKGDIQELLLSLDTTKANGPDDINFQQSCSKQRPALAIATGVMILFNKSTQLGEVPGELKRSLIKPIPEEGDTS